MSPRESAQTPEQRVARLERRRAYAEELIDEAHIHLTNLELLSGAPEDSSMSRYTMKAPRRADNQGMSFKLAEAVSEAADPAASPSSAIVAAGLVAIAASLDRLLVFFEILDQEDRTKSRAREGGQ